MTYEYTVSTDVPVFEPLSASAPIAFQLAQAHCGEGQSEGACRTYHSIWQYLRLIGQISTIASDDDFFPPRIAALLAEGGYNQVLISASADYGMLARVVAASKAAEARPEMTLVDICPTPLRLNEWYAAEVGVNIHTQLENILEFAEHGRFDLICTHSFIGRMLGHRRELLAKWRELLRPGGKVLTSARIRYGVTEPVQKFTEAEAEAFADEARRRAEATETEGLDPDEIREAALNFARDKTSCPLPSREYLTELCEAAGFSVELDSKGIRPASRGRPTSPRTGSGTERARIVLTRL